MTEITERFFQEIAARVGYYRVAEIHLFPPIKQGGQESGVAVIAATPETAPVEGELERHVVYTARYRQTFKGPDRGKWEFDVKAEADAPLITVDEVVRGVVRRSGDDINPERMTGEQFRASVAVPEGQELPEESLEEVPEAVPEVESSEVPVEGDAEEFGDEASAEDSEETPAEASAEASEDVSAEISEEASAEAATEVATEAAEEVLDETSDESLEEPSTEGEEDPPVAEALEDTGDDVTTPELSPEDSEQGQALPEPDDTRPIDSVHA